ncbi:MAG TPA: SDR family oxidoreductase [Caldimonas sp.]|nr:SDR family oxidoreductase [Caldimonas sp.]
MDAPQASSTIVTGGGYGIGRAVSRLLAGDGWAVVVVDRDEAKAAQTCQLIAGAGGRALPVVGNVTVASTLSRACEAARDLAPLRGLVTCAAMRHAGSVTQVSEAGWKETLDVVLNGVFLACKAAIPDMIAAGGGAVVNVSSPDAYGRRGMVSYASAKAAVNALSQCLALDHAGDGIRVNVVLPGFTLTGMTEHYPEARIAQTAARSVARRVAQPEDAARLIRFLMSPEGETFTGGVFGPQGLAYT